MRHNTRHKKILFCH